MAGERLPDPGDIAGLLLGIGAAELGEQLRMLLGAEAALGVFDLRRGPLLAAAAGGEQRATGQEAEQRTDQPSSASVLAVGRISTMQSPGRSDWASGSQKP